MELVTAWEVMEAIGSKIEASEAERALTLRLGEEVAQVQEAGAPSPFSGKTMGDLRDEVIIGLARSFAKAHRISHSAARLHYVLHHTETPRPELFDLRPTGLPCLSVSAFSELQSVLIGTAQFEKRLIAALSSGKFRNFPRHGGPDRISLSLDDWTSHPSDGDTLRKLVFRSEEILPLLWKAGISLGPLHDAFTGNRVELLAPEAEANIESVLDSSGAAEARPASELPQLELVPLEPSRRTSDSDPSEPLQRELNGGRTPRRFTDDELESFEQRHLNGAPWKDIAGGVPIRLGTLEGHMTAYRKKKREEQEREEQALQVPTNAFGQMASNVTRTKNQKSRRP
jgi:hypothetical protein